MTTSAESAPDARAILKAAAVYLPLAVLRPNPKNPRLHGEEVIKLARTIVRTRWGAPLVAQASTLRIIAGHGRYDAAREVLAGIEVDGELRGGAEHYFDADAPGPAMVPVRVIDVPDDVADAMTVADNAKGLQGTDDPVALLEMLSQFGRGTELLKDIGYADAVLDMLAQRGGDDVLGDAGGGDAPEPKRCPHCNGEL